MSTNPQQMTAGTESQMAKAHRIARERHGDRRTRGPMAEMMAENGMSADSIRATGRAWASIHSDMVPVIGAAATDSFIATFQAVADRIDGKG